MGDIVKNSSEKQKGEYSKLTYFISRQVLQQDDLSDISGYYRPKESPLRQAQKQVSQLNFLSIVYSLMPVLKWLPEYPVKRNILGDITSGVTVAVMHIPQGMAYGILAGVEPSVGLYMAFFPTLVYAMFGTSRHISMGTFAVVSLMTAKIVSTYATVNGGEGIHNQTAIDGLAETGELEEYSPIQVACAVSMVVGFYHILMSVLRLGTLASLLSEPLVKGFTTAAAVHVLVSQLKDLVGISVPRYKGAFKIIYTVNDLLRKLDEANLTAVYVSIFVISFMILLNEFLKPWMAKKCRFPLPSEMMAVVGGTAISYFLKLGPTYQVKLVGQIPTGLPMPEAPTLKLLQLVAIDSIAVTIVSYSVVMSMALIFAKKHTYEVRPNQELLAMGFSNIAGSFFSCIPISCSLSRSVIQEQTGGKTQVASVVSAGLILVVLLWVGPYFETLPRCVLAGIIIVALKGMLMQIKELKTVRKEGIFETMVWVGTFLSVVIIDIDIGLMLGICISLLALYIKGWKAYDCLLGEIPDTGIYVDLATHKAATEVPDTKIFRYTGSLNFASKAGFKKSLFDKVGVDTKVMRRASVFAGRHEATGLQGMHTLIIDLSCIAHVDVSACKMFNEIKKEMQLLGVAFLLANPTDRVYDALMHSESYNGASFKVFATVHDAVLYVQGKLDMV